MIFEPIAPPFLRWMGPFSPSRGTKSGFRFHQSRLGTWVSDGSELSSFWNLTESQGAHDIATLVREHWGGGRVLFLANSCVVKPLQEDDEIGKRALIGVFRGSLVLDTPAGKFDLSDPGALQPGDLWPGPATTGLECVLKENGSLVCVWYHPTALGKETETEVLRGTDRGLWHAFKAARPEHDAGRVRITANGLIITNRKDDNGSWISVYVGRIEPGSLHFSKSWITRQ